MSGAGVDVIYIAASARDGRFARTCVASVRHFYPEVPIRVLVGGPLEHGLADELTGHWDVRLADLPPRDYGWGFVKLEPLFRPPGERFLVLDADTVMTGPVLDVAKASDADMIVDDERQDEASARRLYFEWGKPDPDGRPIQQPDFLFNTGQWFGRSGVIRRDDFAGLVDWGGAKPMLVNPQVFKNGDQGVLNHVANRLAREGRLRVDRTPLLCWPGHGLQGVTVDAIVARTAPARVIHWAGFKGARHGRLPGGEVLMYFERLYYAPLGGNTRRRLATLRHATAYGVRRFRDRVQLRLSMTLARRARTGAG
ncbi:MAG TPA: hypothetical protein VHS81_10550 [Caulobacteraceae bacterium]|nr:hypothetical protein [Caulobacteraceae bacterium]